MTAARDHLSITLACKADAALRACLDRMADAGVPEHEQAQWIQEELHDLAARAVDFQRVRMAAVGKRAPWVK